MPNLPVLDPSWRFWCYWPGAWPGHWDSPPGFECALRRAIVLGESGLCRCRPSRGPWWRLNKSPACEMDSQIGPSDLEMYLYFTRLLKFQKFSLKMRSNRAGQIFCCVESNETNGLNISLVPGQERVEHITEIQGYLSSHTPHKAAFPAFSAIRKSTKLRGTWTLESLKPGWPSDPE